MPHIDTEYCPATVNIGVCRYRDIGAVPAWRGSARIKPARSPISGPESLICCLQGRGAWIIPLFSGSRFKCVCLEIVLIWVISGIFISCQKIGAGDLKPPKKPILVRLEINYVNKNKRLKHFGARGCSSVVEHNLAKVGVVSSNLITRSNRRSKRRLFIEIFQLDTSI